MGAPRTPFHDQIPANLKKGEGLVYMGIQMAIVASLRHYVHVTCQGFTIVLALHQHAAHTSTRFIFCFIH